MTESLPFTSGQFFDVFGAYNRALWPFTIALWLSALAGGVILARSRNLASRFIPMLLASQWVWAALAYHVAFFSSINPLAWLFAVLFLVEGFLFAWFGVVRRELHFSASRSPRYAVAWVLIVYALIYPIVVTVEGHTFPEIPTFGVPCPTTLLTIGLLLALDRPCPRAIAAIPILWALVGGSAAVLLGVRADLMLWVGGAALTGEMLVPASMRSFPNA